MLNVIAHVKSSHSSINSSDFSFYTDLLRYLFQFRKQLELITGKCFLIFFAFIFLKNDFLKVLNGSNSIRGHLQGSTISHDYTLKLSLTFLFRFLSLENVDLKSIVGKYSD